MCTILVQYKSFRCNTSGPPRMCCKQRTCAILKSRRCNTYKKHGGGGGLLSTSYPKRIAVLSERSESKDLSSHATKHVYPACPDPVGEEHRDEGPASSSHPTIEDSDPIGKGVCPWRRALFASPDSSGPSPRYETRALPPLYSRSGHTYIGSVRSLHTLHYA